MRRGSIFPSRTGMKDTGSHIEVEGGRGALTSRLASEDEAVEEREGGGIRRRSKSEGGKGSLLEYFGMKSSGEKAKAKLKASAAPALSSIPSIGPVRLQKRHVATPLLILRAACGGREKEALSDWLLKPPPPCSESGIKAQRLQGIHIFIDNEDEGQAAGGELFEEVEEDEWFAEIVPGEIATCECLEGGGDRHVEEGRKGREGGGREKKGGGRRDEGDRGKEGRGESSFAVLCSFSLTPHLWRFSSCPSQHSAHKP